MRHSGSFETWRASAPSGPHQHCEPQPLPPGQRGLAVAVLQAVTSMALGSPLPAPPHASQRPGPELDRVLDRTEAARPEPFATALAGRGRCS